MNPTRLLVSLLISLLLTAPVFPIEPPLLPQTVDLKRLGNTAESRGLPILLMVSQSDCGYCEKMKRQVLNPMQLSGDYEQRILMRELLTDSGETVVNFEGRCETAEKFRYRYNIQVTPTLLFLDSRGREVAQRILGVNSVDYLPIYIEEAIETSIRSTD